MKEVPSFYRPLLENILIYLMKLTLKFLVLFIIQGWLVCLAICLDLTTYTTCSYIVPFVSFLSFVFCSLKKISLLLLSCVYCFINLLIYTCVCILFQSRSNLFASLYIEQLLFHHCLLLQGMIYYSSPNMPRILQENN